MRSDTVPDMKAERFCEIHIVQISHFLDEKIEAWRKMGPGQGNTSEWLGLSLWTDGKKGCGDPRCVGEVRGSASPTWMWMELSSWTSGSLVLAPDPRHMSPHLPHLVLLPAWSELGIHGIVLKAVTGSWQEVWAGLEEEATT